MGRLTEAFAYLSSEPKKVEELKKTFSHITVDDKLKKIRKENKFWKKDKKVSVK